MMSRAPMIRAVWNGAVLAEASRTVVVEGNHYYPRPSFLARRVRHHVAFWRGVSIERDEP